MDGRLGVGGFGLWLEPCLLREGTDGHAPASPRKTSLEGLIPEDELYLADGGLALLPPGGTGVRRR